MLHHAQHLLQRSAILDPSVVKPGKQIITNLTTKPSCCSCWDSSALLLRPTTRIRKARARRAHAWPMSPYLRPKRGRALLRDVTLLKSTLGGSRTWHRSSKGLADQDRTLQAITLWLCSHTNHPWASMQIMHFQRLHLLPQTHPTTPIVLPRNSSTS